LFVGHILVRKKKKYANIKINKKKSERCIHTYTGKHMTSTQIQITWPHMPDVPRPPRRPASALFLVKRRKGKENLWAHTQSRTENKTNLTRNYNEQIARPGLKATRTLWISFFGGRKVLDNTKKKYKHKIKYKNAGKIQEKAERERLSSYFMRIAAHV